MSTLSPTRSEALARARAEYRNLVGRVLVMELAPTDYVESLSRLWDSRLADLARLGSSLAISIEVDAALSYLADAVRQANDAETDVVLHWLDAFPDAVADLFPPSAITYRLAETEGSASIDAGVVQGASDLVLAA